MTDYLCFLLRREVILFLVAVDGDGATAFAASATQAFFRALMAADPRGSGHELTLSYITDFGAQNPCNNSLYPKQQQCPFIHFIASVP